MKRIIFILAAVMSFIPLQASAQIDKKDVRRGNRDFKKENFKEAEIDYRKALVKDSLSVAANYNLANTLYREGDYAQAQQTLERIKEIAPQSASAADYYFNLGDAAIQQKNWQAAVDAFRESLILRPDDLLAKENYIYAKEMLKDQQNQNQDQDQQNQDQQDQQNQADQNEDPNQNQNNDKNQNDDQNNQDKPDEEQKQPQQNQGQQPKISPQAAQQMLQAIQAKEKETQDKVNKQKAEALKSRQKEKNW